MTVHAIVHTTGVVLGKQYIPLEFAYYDVTHFEGSFLLTSPFTLQEALQTFPHAQPDAKMCKHEGYSLVNIKNFLYARYYDLQKALGPVNIIFGYKGDGYQKQFLLQMNLPSIVNVETMNVPSLYTLRRMYPQVVTQYQDCVHHDKPTKCAMMSVSLLAVYMCQHNLILPLSQQQLFT